MHLPKNDSATKHKKESSTNRTEPSSETNNDDAPFGAAEHLNRLYAQRCLYPESVYNRFQKSIFEKPNFLGNRDSLKGVKVTYEDRTGNATFLKGNELLTLMIFGELAPMSEGTRVTAIGNHYPWSEPVSVKERVKWILVLREPSMSPPEVARAWDRQCDHLNELLIMSERGRETMAEALARGQRIKPFARTVQSRTDKLLPLYTHGPIYSEERQTSQSILGEGLASDESIEASKVRMTVADARAKVHYPISTSTCYHPDCLVDHHDSRFNDHVGVNLYQKDIRDIRGQLVEPWKMQEVYRPGTLVLAVCTFKMWSQGKDGSEEPNHLRQVKIVAESPEEEEGLNIFPGQTTQYISRSDMHQTLPEFDAFNPLEEPPAKRPRLAGPSTK